MFQIFQISTSVLSRLLFPISHWSSSLPPAVAPSFTAPCLTQFLRHCNFSNVSVVIESLCDVNVSLARLNDLSQSVAIAGIASISRASWLTMGNCPRRPIHHSIGSSVSCGSSRRYRSSSLPIAVVFAVLLLTHCLNTLASDVFRGTIGDAALSTIAFCCSSTGRLQRYQRSR